MHRLEKRPYDSSFQQSVLDAKLITIDALLDQTEMSAEFAYKVTYANPREFRRIADKFKLMNDFRGGMIRTAYYGIITFTVNKIRVYVVPAKLDLEQDFGEYPSDSIYELKWDLMNRFLDFQALYCRPGKWGSLSFLFKIHTPFSDGLESAIQKTRTCVLGSRRNG
jgi:hypothetical protein